MRGKRIAQHYTAHRIAHKDSLKSGIDQEDTIIFKKSMKGEPTSPRSTMEGSPPGSPDSIFHSLAPKLPTMMPLLPKPAMPLEETPSLPVTAVWGNAHKLMLAKRSRHETLEAVIDEYLAFESLVSRARLPTKVHFETAAARNVKAMERGLLNKYWIKQRAQKHAKRAEYEARVAAEEAAEAAATNEEEAAVETAVVAPTCKPRREYAAKREKVRRDARRQARDLKCFSYDDPIEWVELEAPPSADARGQPLKQRQKKRAGRMRSMGHVLHATIKLLSVESTGAALADVFTGGVALSCAAASDLNAMITASSQTPFDERTSLPLPSVLAKEGMPSTKTRKKKLLSSTTPLRTKMAKTSGGTAGYLRQPSMVKAQGKRHA